MKNYIIPHTKETSTEKINRAAEKIRINSIYGSTNMSYMNQNYLTVFTGGSRPISVDPYEEGWNEESNRIYSDIDPYGEENWEK